ncbi:carbohydrate binding domain-containing protein [Chengkuizengella axinellae]|uniref:Carbohydrate binding domain-containing protein n=1 Tax=Chengkuizengella axinellae TaxID=3064388 RepID=A0ABT9J0M4_9BACL|nr:carbohydrate binding domain-containing protein [Chengkuizengella sp. 2205SS18-9]MDP5275153.1 carbohydrate binding domain-containing protein [Chengkuizengella sp. 2205SS18-9]
MNNKRARKLLVVLLTFSMIFSMISPVFAAGSSDIDGHWAEKQLKQWIENGLLNGYGEGVYKPNQTITRAEAAALVNRSFEHEETAEVAFSDVEVADWFYNDVSKALAAGFMTGYENGTFKPDQNITRQELAVMVFRLLDLEVNANAVASYDDVDSIADWAKGEIGALVDLGIVTGYNDNTIQPEGLTKRAEAIVMIERAFEYLFTYNEAGTYGPEEGIETITHNVTVTASDVTLQNLVIEGDLLLAEGIGEGDVFLNNVTVNGTTTILGGGENSVHLTDTVLVTVIVDKKDGNIRIVVKGESEVKEVTLNSGAKLEESELDGAGFTDVILSTEVAKDSNVELVGEFNSVEVKAVSVEVELPQGSSIESLVLEVAAKITGDGDVTSLGGDGVEDSTVEVDVEGESQPKVTKDDDDDDPIDRTSPSIKSASVVIGDQTLSAVKDARNEFHFVLPLVLADGDMITQFSIESSSDTKRLSGKSTDFNVDIQDFEASFKNGKASFTVSDLLGDLDLLGDGVSVGTIRSLLGDNLALTITGSIEDDDGNDSDVILTINFEAPVFEGVEVQEGSIHASTNLIAPVSDGNYLAVKVTNALTPIERPLLGEMAPNDYSVNYPESGDDISGVDEDINNILAVYEINENNEIIKFTLVELSSEDISNEKWDLVWEDNFDGSSIDGSKWNFIQGGGGYGNNEWQNYTNREENARVEDGSLILEAHEESFGGNDYTSAKLTTEGKGDWTYGKYEFRAKMPEGQGIWPAIWMMPTDYELYGEWPSSGEIDIMEYLGHDPYSVYGTLHYGNPWTHTGQQFQLPDGGSFADEYHTFSLEWEPGEMRWYVDGILFSKQNDWFTKHSNEGAEFTYPAPYDRDFYIQLNLAVGGNWPGYPDETTVFPQQMLIDYVRVYELDGEYREAGERPGPSPYRNIDNSEAREPLEDGNHVYNGSFEDGLEYWDFQPFETPDQFGGIAEISTENGVAEITIEQAGDATHAVQFVHPDIPLVQGEKYRLSFDAKTEGNRDMIVAVSGPNRNYERYTPDRTIQLTSDFDTISYDFKMELGTNYSARIEFNMGQASDLPVWIDNVRLEKLEVDPNAARDVLPNGNHIYNGRFDQGSDRMIYWDFETNGSADATTSVGSEIADRELDITIDNGGETLQSIILKQNKLNIQDQTSYILSFDASSSSDRTIDVQLKNEQSDLVYEKENEQIQLTNTMEAYSVVFDVNDENAEKGELQFWLGGEDDSDVTIDNVTLKVVTPPTVVDYKTVIEAENYSDMFGVQAENEGQTIGFIDQGDWLQYMIDVEEAGEYVISYLVATANSGSMTLLVEEGSAYTGQLPFGQEILEEDADGIYSMDVASTGGWNEWNFVRQTVELNEGVQTLQLYSPGVNHDVFIISSASDTEGEILVNGNLELGEAEWLNYVHNPDLGSIDIQDGQIDVSIVEESDQFWHIHLKQADLALKQGEKYLLSFDANTSLERDILVKVEAANFAPVGEGAEQIIKISPDNTSYEMSFTATDDMLGSLVVGLGGNIGDNGDNLDSHTITFDNFSIIEEWTLVWNDEFDGTEVDPNKWTFDIGNGEGGWGNNELEYYTDRPENAKVENGNLVITAKYEEDGYNGFDYTSAKLKTDELESWKYGKFEARIKLPTGQGLWPAFWMMPQNSEYGDWASSGEIDIMENWGSRPTEIGGAIHMGEDWPNNSSKHKNIFLPDGGVVTDWHTYGIEWEPGEIRWYVDGELYSTINNWYSKSLNQPLKNSFPAPFDKEFYMIMNLAVGGHFDGNPADNSIFDAEMLVDYVRVYELTGRPYMEVTSEPEVDMEPIPDEARKPLDDGNYVYNNNFDQNVDGEDSIEGVDGTSYWQFLHVDQFQGDGDVSIVEIDNRNYAKVDITQSGNQPFSIQLIQHLPVVKGHWYKLSFDAKTEDTRNISVKVGAGEDLEYIVYSPNETFSLTDEFNTYELLFQMPENTDINARIEFNLGLNDQDVWIGNVRFDEVEEPLLDFDAPHPPAGDGNLVYNGTFDQGYYDRLTYWQFATSNRADLNLSVGEETRELKVDVTDDGSNARDASVYQNGIELLEGETYELSFDARAKQGHDVNVELRNLDGSDIYFAETVSLTTDMEAYIFDFEMIEESNDLSQLAFYIGGQNTEVYFDNVKLIRTSIYDGVDLFPLKNGDFENGMDPWNPLIIDGGDGSFDINGNGEFQGNVNVAGDQPYSFLLIQSGLELKNGIDYIVSFNARATKNRDMLVTIEDSDYTRYFEDTVQLTSEMQTFSYEFTMEGNTIGDLKFSYGNLPGSDSAHEVIIDDVVLEVKNARQVASILENGTFDQGLTDWGNYFHNDAGAIGGVSVNDEQLVVDITNEGTDFWHAHVLQADLEFEEGQSYLLSFDAASTVDRKIQVKVENSGNQPVGANAEQIIDISSDMKTYEFPFVSNEENGALVLGFGGGIDGQSTIGAHEITLDNISIIEWGEYTPEPEPEPHELLNGSFDDGTSDWEFGERPEFQVIDGVMEINIGNLSGGPALWDLTLKQNNLALEQGKVYELSYDAYSTIERDILVKIEDSDYNPVGVGADRIEKITTENNKTYSFQFSMDYDLPSGNLVFGVGTELEAHTVYIDNITLSEVEIQNQSIGDELIQDGSFESNFEESWGSWTEVEGLAGYTVENTEELKVVINSLGNFPHSIQLLQEGLVFIEGNSYRVNFRAKADKERPINVNVGKPLAMNPWFNKYTDTVNETLSTEYRDYSFEFTMDQYSYNNGRIVIELGKINDELDFSGNVYFDDISITVVENPELNEDVQPLEIQAVEEGQEEVDQPVDDPTGDDPAGDDPTGDDPAGDDPTGDDPAGDDPTGDDPAGDDPAGDDPAGDDPAGDDPAGDDPAGDDPTGDDPAGDDPAGDDPTGDDPAGDDPTGDDPAGDDPAGDDPAGDDPSEEPQPAEEPSGE